MLCTPWMGRRLVQILWPCWTSLATITSRKLSTASRSPALSGTQISKSSGDSGWSMKTSVKVSDVRCGSYAPAGTGGLAQPARHPRGVCRECGHSDSPSVFCAHPWNFEGLIAKAKSLNESVGGIVDAGLCVSKRMVTDLLKDFTATMHSPSVNDCCHGRGEKEENVSISPYLLLPRPPHTAGQPLRAATREPLLTPSCPMFGLMRPVDLCDEEFSIGLVVVWLTVSQLTPCSLS